MVGDQDGLGLCERWLLQGCLNGKGLAVFAMDLFDTLHSAHRHLLSEA